MIHEGPEYNKTLSDSDGKDEDGNQEAKENEENSMQKSSSESHRNSNLNQDLIIDSQI